MNYSHKFPAGSFQSSTMIAAKHLHEKKYITHKEYKAIFNKANSFTPGQDEEAKTQMVETIDRFLLCNKLQTTKGTLQAKKRGKQAILQTLNSLGFNNAHRLTILAKDALKAGLLTYEDYCFIWNNLKVSGQGLSNDLVNSLISNTFLLLKFSHPLYQSLTKGEKHVQQQLSQLNFFKPLIP